MLWSYVTRSNNWPHNIATYNLDVVEHQGGGCPQKLITDLGTENDFFFSPLYWAGFVAQRERAQQDSKVP